MSFAGSFVGEIIIGRPDKLITTGEHWNIIHYININEL
jgi:hypothetical protein